MYTLLPHDVFYCVVCDFSKDLQCLAVWFFCCQSKLLFGVMEKIFVKDICVGAAVSSYFLVAKKEKKLKKNGDPYLRVTFADNTGSIEANIWDNVASAFDVLNHNTVVAVQGDVSEYKGTHQLTVRSVSACADNEYELSCLIKQLPNIDEICGAVQKLLHAIKDAHLRALTVACLSDDDFMNKFLRCPGGMGWHHAYIGGLLQHTYEVMRLGHEMCLLNPEVNEDLIIAGAFLHDIGKVHELLYETNFDYTDSGKLLGHICIGYDMVAAYATKVPDFPADLLMELRHIILSHQGEYEHRSPVVPQTVEACIVYHCDNLSSQTNAFRSVVYGPRMDGETWSKYFPIIGRQMRLREEKNIFERQ